MKPSESASWPPYSIPLDEAESRVRNWIDGEPVSPAQMRAFVVHRADFIELLAQHDTEFVRLYLARKEDPDNPDVLRPCLILVSADRHHPIESGVEDTGRIVDLIGAVKTGTDGDAHEETYHVFDFSKGCPPVCDPESPLFVSGDGAC